MEKALSVKKAAEIADVYEMTVYKAIWEGRLQTIKTGRRHKITPEAFRQWNATRGRWPKPTPQHAEV